MLLAARMSGSFVIPLGLEAHVGELRDVHLLRRTTIAPKLSSAQEEDHSRRRTLLFARPINRARSDDVASWRQSSDEHLPPLGPKRGWQPDPESLGAGDGAVGELKTVPFKLRQGATLRRRMLH
jgi:hypothetical protein